MRKTFASLLAVPMLFFGVAFADDLGGSIDEQGAGSGNTGVESQQMNEDTNTTIDQQKTTDEEGNEYKAPEKNNAPAADAEVPSTLPIPDTYDPPE